VILQQVSWGIAIRMAVLERAILGDSYLSSGVAA
jgi:aspartate carbamoyltransferase catalytic subunit